MCITLKFKSHCIPLKLNAFATHCTNCKMRWSNSLNFTMYMYSLLKKRQFFLLSSMILIPHSILYLHK